MAESLGDKIGAFGRETVVYSLSTVASRFVGIFLVPIYTRIFSPEEYGVLDMVGTFYSFIMLVLYMGLDSAMGRYYADAENDIDRRLTASTGLFFLISVSMVCVGAASSISGYISRAIFKTTIHHPLIVVALLTIPFSLMSSYTQKLFRWRFESSRFAVTSVGTIIVQTGLSIYLVVFLRIGVMGVYLAGLITAMLFSFVNIWLTRSSFAFVFSVPRLKALLAFGMPLVPLSVAHYIMTYSDRYFLMHFRGLEEIGVYGIAYRISSVIGLVVTGFQLAWGPFVYSTYRNAEAGRMFRQIFDYFSIGACTAVFVLSIFSQEILIVFTTEAYVHAYGVVPLIAASIIAYTIGGNFTIGIGIAKKNIHRTWAGASAAMINLILNYLLIPRYGMVGAAVATLASFSIMGVLLFYISEHYYAVSYRFKAHLVMYCSAGLLIFIAYRYFPRGVTFESLVLKTMVIALFLMVLFLTRWIEGRYKERTDGEFTTAA